MQTGDNYIFDMQIGNLTISGRVVLAPMAGVTDLPFRRLCRRFGAAIVYSEFLSSDGLILNSKGQHHKLTLADDEHPVAYQLFGSRIETFGQAAQCLAEFGPDLIDLNFGCPVKKVVKNNGGSAILKDLELMGRIIAETANAVDLPVTVKMRAGWDHENLVHLNAARIAIEAGAKAITLHARTRADAYQHEARWEYISELRKTITVPLIGNGDVDTPQKARMMLDQTGCDAVMIGRGALGRPWIFHQINHFLETSEVLPEPCLTDRLSVALGHLTEKTGEMFRIDAAIRHMRRQLSSYVRGLPQSHELRERLMHLESLEEIRDLFVEYLKIHADVDRTEGDDWIGSVLPLDKSWLKSAKSIAPISL